MQQEELTIQNEQNFPDRGLGVPREGTVAPPVVTEPLSTEAPSSTQGAIASAFERFKEIIGGRKLDSDVLKVFEGQLGRPLTDEELDELVAAGN